jgi:sugar lactone lactonase YvrE
MKRLLIGVCSGTIVLVCGFRAGADTFYVTELFGSDVFKLDSAGNKTVFATGLNLPRGIAVDASGNVFVADNSIDVIYEYSPSGARTTFATGVAGGPMGMTFDSSGNLFVGTQGGTIYKYDPAGNRTLFATNNQTSQVTNLAFATSGDLYAAYPDANAIHRFTTSGDGTFVTSNQAVGLAFDSIGNLFVTDNFNGIITEYNPAGVDSVRQFRFVQPVGPDL